MRSTVVQIVVLTLVCLISSLSLALVNNLTKDRIAEQKRLAELRAVEVALPKNDLQYNNDPSKDIVEIHVPNWKERDGSPKKIYPGKKEGKIVGVAFKSVGEGYGGYITIMMGVDMKRKITGIEILPGHQETPGLGANIENPELFENQFRGKFPESSQEGKLVVVKVGKADDDWEIEALTGATVSPNGVVKAVNGGLAMFRQYEEKVKKKILAGKTPREETE